LDNRALVKDSDFEPANVDFRTNCRLAGKTTSSAEPKSSNDRDFSLRFQSTRATTVMALQVNSS